MKNYQFKRTAFAIGLLATFSVWTGSFSVGWPQPSPNDWEWEAAKRVFIEKSMHFQHAACKKNEFELLNAKKSEDFRVEKEKELELATKNFQHALHLQGLQQQRFEKMQKAFLKKERSYSDVFKELTPAQLAVREAVQLHCFKVGILKNPEMTEQLEKVIEKLENNALASKDSIRKLTSETFSQLFVDWWGEKRTLLQDLTSSSLSQTEYLAKRYQSINKYRHVLDGLFRQSLSNESSYSDFAPRIEEIDSLIKRSGSLQARWKSIKGAIKLWIPKIPSTLHQEMGVVTGVLVNKETQDPAAGIPIILRNIPGKLTDVRYKTKSDAMGRFVFPQVAPGDYVLSSKLTFGPEGNYAYRSKGEILFIRMSEVLVIDFALKYEKVTFQPASSPKK